MNNDLHYVLFIIYHTLASISKTFTHYDLHTNNVLLFEPTPGKYIHYHYHLSGGEMVEFKCPFIPKIIDYGRSFFDNGNVTSATIKNKICNTVECNPNCGENVGFTWSGLSHLIIYPEKKNESHDLRLLKIVHEIIHDYGDIDTEIKPIKDFYKVLKKVKYGVGILFRDEEEFGTQENITSHPIGGDITNVADAYKSIKSVIKTQKYMDKNESKYMDILDKLGDFHIYDDGRDMEYISI